MRGEKRPQRGGQQPGAAIGQPCAQQIGRADAAQGHERDGRAGGVIVDPAPDHLPEGIEQRQQLRVIVHAGGNLAGQGEDAGVVAVDPQGVIGGEGPVGDADHAQDQGDDQAGHDQALPARQRDARYTAARRGRLLPCPPQGCRRAGQRQRPAAEQRPGQCDRPEGAQQEHGGRQANRAQRQPERPDHDPVGPVRAGQDGQRPRDAHRQQAAGQHRQDQQRGQQPVTNHALRASSRSRRGLYRLTGGRATAGEGGRSPLAARRPGGCTFSASGGMLALCWAAAGCCL